MNPEPSLDLMLLAAFCAVREQSAGELAVVLERSGLKLSREVVSLALADLQHRLETNPEVYPFRLREEGARWVLVGSTPTTDQLLTRGKVMVREPLTEKDLQVLAVIVFKEDGVSASRIQECIGVDPTTALSKLERQELIYPVPRRGWTTWCASPKLLTRFGFKSFDDIPNFQEYRAFVAGEKSADDVLESVPAASTKKRRKGRPS